MAGYLDITATTADFGHDYVCAYVKLDSTDGVESIRFAESNGLVTLSFQVFASAGERGRRIATCFGQVLPKHRHDFFTLLGGVKEWKILNPILDFVQDVQCFTDHSFADIFASLGGLAERYWDHDLGTPVVAPKIGDDVVYNVGSDRYVGTVAWVSETGKTIRYHSSRVPTEESVDHEFLAGISVYSARWDPKSFCYAGSRARFGRYRVGVSILPPGTGVEYRDPSF